MRGGVFNLKNVWLAKIYGHVHKLNEKKIKKLNEFLFEVKSIR